MLRSLFTASRPPHDGAVHLRTRLTCVRMNSPSPVASMRPPIAILIGFGATIALISMLEGIGYAIWPTMNGVDLNNTEAVRRALAGAPTPALIWIVSSYGVA